MSAAGGAGRASPNAPGAAGTGQKSVPKSTETLASGRTVQVAGARSVRHFPSVGVVLATHNRPQLMREALASILDQDYPGSIEVVLVFDRSEPDLTLQQDEPGRSVRVISNDRTPGLAGARNTGILQLTTELVAFCDDDDTWLPSKLNRQVERLRVSPEADFVTTAMLVDCDGHETVRRAHKKQVTIQDMVRSRMAMLHSSSFVFRRLSMVEGFGLVDETLPRSMAEDWDLLLRAARKAPIEHIDDPLVRILWGSTSYFNDAWRDKNEAHAWLLEHHPEIDLDAKGASLLYGKLAYGNAVLGNRQSSVRFIQRCLRRNWREPRAYIAAAVCLGLSGEWVQRQLNQRGHGI